MKKETVVDIGVKYLIPSAWNRTDLGNGELKELSNSIKAEGVLVPLIVRPMGKDDFEVVAGHRRLEAAKDADILKVPCIVRELSDDEAKRVQILENLHRKNLNPMEEAQAFKQLMEGNAHNAQSIADSVGKDVKYVYRSLELLNLPEQARKALEKGILSAAHGHQLVRVNPKQMDTVVSWVLKPGWKGEISTVQQLKEEIARRVEKDLAAAPFEKNKEYAGKVACKGCPSNTANQSMLFDGAVSGKCTNGSCFSSKLHQFYKDFQAVGEKKWPGLKFIGTASGGYGSSQTLKGYQVVNEKDPKVKARLKAPAGAPALEAFGFGILKPSNWSSIKVPRLVVLKKMSAKESVGNNDGRYHQRSPEEQAKVDFVANFVARDKAILMWGGEFGPGLFRAICIQYLSNGWALRETKHILFAAGMESEGQAPLKTVDDVAKAVCALTDTDARKLMVMLLTNDNEMEEIVSESAGFNEDAQEKRSTAMAVKEWEAQKDIILAELQTQKQDEGDR